MGVERVSSSRQSLHTRALGRAVDLALKDVKKVQSRMTEELRAEDAIRGLELHGREVHVLVDGRYEVKPDGLRDLVKELLKKHGAAGARVELHKVIDPQQAVQDALASIEQVQGRMTADMRAEDDVKNVVLDGSTVKVVLGPRPYFSEAEIKDTVLEHLKKAGLKRAEIEFIRPAIQPIRPPVIRPTLPPVTTMPIAAPVTMKQKVEAFAADVKTVQSRMTEELRIEDAISTIKIVGAKVEVTFFKRTAFDEASIKDFVKDELKTRGVQLPVTFKAKDPRDV